MIHRHLDGPEGMFRERLATRHHLRILQHAFLQSFQHFMMHPTFDCPAIFAGGALRSQRATLTLFGGVEPKLFLVTGLPARPRLHREFSSLWAEIQVSAGVIRELCARE